jgi:hypothetical protein
MSGLEEVFKRRITTPTMSEETDEPESVTDEQLEDVAGGTMDNFVITKNCTAILSTISL